jgi:hypothetical protein
VPLSEIPKTTWARVVEVETAYAQVPRPQSERPLRLLKDVVSFREIGDG